jgi:phosphoglycolate phosphatase-like HAD superfamily hydrolase
MNNDTLLLRGKNTVLLDLDGTLVDSVRAHARAWQDVLAAWGHERKLEQLERLIGMGGDKLVALAAGISDEGKVQSIADRRSKLFRERYLDDVYPIAGAKRLINVLRDGGYTVFLATASAARDRDALLEKCGLNGLFNEFVSPAEVDASKPDPDLLQAILKKLEVPASSCVLIGDSPYDAQAAARAQMDFIAVESGKYKREELPQAQWSFASVQELATALER